MPDGRLTEEPDAVLIQFADLIGIPVTQEQLAGRLHGTDECVPDDIGLVRHAPAVTVSYSIQTSLSALSVLTLLTSTTLHAVSGNCMHSCLAVKTSARRSILDDAWAQRL